MKIAFDVTTCAKPELGGISRYGRSLVQACARVAPEHEYRLGVRPNRWMRRRHVADLLPGVRPRLLLDSAPGLNLGPGFGGPDVLHSIGVRLPPRARCARVVTLHDVNVFEFPELAEPEWREKRQRRIRQTLLRADLAIAYSRHGADAIARLVSFPRERVRVVPIGVDSEEFRRPAAERVRAVREALDLGERPYVLQVGAYGSRKNQDGLLAAFARARLPAEWVLVLAGPRGDQVPTLRGAAQAAGLAEERLRLPGRVAHPEHVALLGGAAMLAVPSMHEGFGIPVIEAQACGTPVLASNRAALPETVGDCGLLFDPTDDEAFVAALERMADDADLRAELSRRGPERVREEFSWDRIAAATLAVHAEAASARAG
ncbi:MAG: glycosyltransferase family 4 protein [Planctomycetota bacterium]